MSAAPAVAPATESHTTEPAAPAITSTNPETGATTTTQATSAPGVTTSTTTTKGDSAMDQLDQGIDTILKKVGHSQNRQTVEKISDGVRGFFKKVTGKDIPIADKN